MRIVEYNRIVLVSRVRFDLNIESGSFLSRPSSALSSRTKNKAKWVANKGREYHGPQSPLQISQELSKHRANATMSLPSLHSLQETIPRPNG